jgi:hypothetical protein
MNAGTGPFNLHVPDYLILPYGREVKSDLQKIALSAVSADGLYFSTDVPVIFINKANRRPMCLGDFDRHYGLKSDIAPRPKSAKERCQRVK